MKELYIQPSYYSVLYIHKEYSYGELSQTIQKAYGVHSEVVLDFAEFVTLLCQKHDKQLQRTIHDLVYVIPKVSGGAADLEGPCCMDAKVDASTRINLLLISIRLSKV